MAVHNDKHFVLEVTTSQFGIQLLLNLSAICKALQILALHCALVTRAIPPESGGHHSAWRMGRGHLTQLYSTVLLVCPQCNARISLASQDHTRKNRKWSGDLGPLHVNLWKAIIEQSHVSNAYLLAKSRAQNEHTVDVTGVMATCVLCLSAVPLSILPASVRFAGLASQRIY